MQKASNNDKRVPYKNGKQAKQGRGDYRGFNPRGKGRDQGPTGHTENKNDSENVVVGIHPVESLLEKDPGKINHLVFQHNSENKKLYELQKLGDSHKIRIHQLPIQKLNYWYKGNHQGVIAFCNDRSLDTWEHVQAKAQELLDQGKYPRLVLAAGMEDPRNLGASIRSALALGATAVLLPHKGTCGLTPTAAKASAGASEKIPICRVPDLSQELEKLRNKGFVIFGIESEGTVSIQEANYQSPTVLVVGGEDKGIPPHVKRECSQLLKIPMHSLAHSYNASVALSLLLYEVNRQEGFQQISHEI
jgi:23S rRNA (guanosine2251-2'-O)-methyltransferase